MRRKGKQPTAVILSLICFFSLCLSSYDARNAKLSRQGGGTYRLLDGSSTIDGVLHRSVDMSHWQGDIGWDKARADDVDFVMPGTRYKGGTDPKFRENAEQTVKSGVKIGACIYSYATMPEEAEQGADFILKLIRDYPISHPIAFNAENEKTLGSLPKAQISTIVHAFCKKISDVGYYPILYANDYWIQNKLDMPSLSQYPVWVAAYERTSKYDRYVMWQDTDSGAVASVQGNVDVDPQFVDFSDKIPPNSWKKFDGVWYHYENYRMQKNALIFDGKDSYYLQDDGMIYTGGFKEVDGSKRYFEPSSDKMRLGWRQIDDEWYHFSESGVLEIGWTFDGGKFYYAAPDGTMQTGWLDDNGSLYYLNQDGSMQTRWLMLEGNWYLLGDDGVTEKDQQTIDNLRYYFGQDGRMLTGWQKLDGKWYYLGQGGDSKTGWRKIDNSWYYFGPDGVMQNGWQQLGGNWYCLNGSGAMKAGWIQVNGSWYYLSKDGVLQTGWRSVNGSWYYLGSDGTMRAGVTDVGGTLYSLGSSGAMQINTEIDYAAKHWTIDGNGAMYEAAVPDSDARNEQLTVSAGTKVGRAPGSTKQAELKAPTAEIESAIEQVPALTVSAPAQKASVGHAPGE